jgi:hypothetical protein
MAAGLALAVAACGGGDGDAGDPDGPGLRQNLTFFEVESNAFSGVRVPHLAAVNDDAAWAALWAGHTSNISPAPPRPAVDFTTQTVAAVFLGETTNCTRPVVESVGLTTIDRIRVVWRVVGPTASEPCPAVVTSPTLMVRFGNVARHPVEFVRLQ